jgi:di/tripeptidase
MLETGSTDANVLLAASIPAVVVGISQGGNAHRTDEFIDTQLVTEGIWQLILLLAAVATEFGYH